MSSPIKIRYYQLTNAGPTVIYPALIQWPNGSFIWEQSGVGLGIDEGEHRIIDLTGQGIRQNATFALSEKTYAGKTKSESQQAFQFDPTSNMMASCTCIGGTLDGHLLYNGVQIYSGAAAKQTEAHNVQTTEVTEITEVDI